MVVYRTGALAVIAAYYVLNWTRSGQTLGMRAWRLRAVSDTGKPLELGPRSSCGSCVRCWRWAPAALGVLWLYSIPDTWPCMTGCRGLACCT